MERFRHRQAIGRNGFRMRTPFALRPLDTHVDTILDQGWSGVASTSRARMTAHLRVRQLAGGVLVDRLFGLA
jgi:hypothetical protein